MAQRYEGKVAVVTGAARGQGRAHAVRLAEEGADVIVLDVCAPLPTIKYQGSTPDELAETAKTIEGMGRRVVAREVDIRDLEALEAAITEGVAELGRLDVVVGNAGICSAGKLWELTPEEFRTMIDVNLIGTWHTLKVTVPILIEQGTGGAIVLTSSVAGLRGLPFFGHYVASKHAVTGMANSLANELGQYNIRVLTIHPNGVRTEMTTGDPSMNEFLQEYPMLGPIFMGTLPIDMAEPEDIAATVAFLASDEARCMTGSQVAIDLGKLAR
jgi:SDR family mycofactocin-dependent oxidoreductase